MKANYGSKKGGNSGRHKPAQTSIPNRNIKQQNMKMKVNTKKNQRIISRKGRP